MAMEAPPHHEGFIRKSHASKPLGVKSVVRYLVVRGFTASYFVDDHLKKVKGHFDLRNVVRMKPVSDGEVDDEAVELVIVEPQRVSS